MNTQNTLYAIDQDLTALYHYGVKGQKKYQHDPNRRWQRQAVYANGQPDPNAKDRRSKSDDEAFKAYASTIDGLKLTNNSKELNRLRSKYDQHVQDYMNSSLSRMNSEHGNQYRYKVVTDAMLNEHPIEKLSELKHLDGSLSQAQVRMNINHPNDGAESAGRHFNCQNCSIAFEMTERGYDVVARIKKDGSNVEGIADNFIGGKLTPMLPNDNPFGILDKYGKLSENDFDKEYGKACKAAGDNLDRTIRRHGNGARGIVVEGFCMSDDPHVRTTAYHAFNYKVEGDKIRYYDVQGKERQEHNGGAGVDIQ